MEKESNEKFNKACFRCDKYIKDKDKIYFSNCSLFSTY